MASLEDIEKDIYTATQQMEAWAKKREALTNQLVITRTASYEPALVSRARGAGVNPDNFESQQSLAEALEIHLEQHPEILEREAAAAAQAMGAAPAPSLPSGPGTIVNGKIQINTEEI